MIHMLDLNLLEISIFSRIKAEFSQKIKSKYPSLSFTLEEASKTPPRFPNVYVYLMPGNEIGKTMEGDAFEGGLYTFQIRVTNNSGADAVREITMEIVRIMKKMLFSIVATPVYENDMDTQWSVMRFRRSIGQNDIL